MKKHVLIERFGSDSFMKTEQKSVKAAPVTIEHESTPHWAKIRQGYAGGIKVDIIVSSSASLLLFLSHIIQSH